MRIRFFSFLGIPFLLFALFAAGCSRHPVRHLASDAGLLTPGSMTKEEVLAYYGPPDRKIEQNNNELWIYQESRKSFMRKMPYIGEKMGSSEYDMIIITFEGDVVKGGKYRMLDEKEFHEMESKTIGNSK